MTPLEIAGNVFTVASVHLARRNSVHTWWTGMLAVSLYGVMFFGVKLYADVLLQVFFFGTCIVGWWQWLHGGVGGGELPISRLGGRERAVTIATILVFALGFGLAFSRYTDAALPYADSYILGGSVVAQLLMMRRRLDHWPIWISVDAVAVVVYAAKGLHLTSVVYAGLLVLCVLGALEWRRILASQEVCDAVS
jgi:nicotinamide mononucleotide transporter